MSGLYAYMRGRNVGSFGSLTSGTNRCLSRTRILYSVMTSVTFTLDRTTSAVPSRSAFVGTYGTTFTLSQHGSLKFTPSQGERKGGTITTHGSQRRGSSRRDREQCASKSSVSDSLLAEVLLSVDGSICVLLVRCGSRAGRFLRTIRTATVLFYPSPSDRGFA